MWVNWVSQFHRKIRPQTTSTETNTEMSEEEYLQKLKEIRMMNAQERRHLYEKYGRARSNLTKFEADSKLKLSGWNWIFFFIFNLEK